MDARKSKYRTIINIVKDVICMVIRTWIVTLMFCTAFENGWLPGALGIPRNLSYNEFWSVYETFFVISIIIIFFKGITGQYTARVYVVSEITCVKAETRGNSEL